MYSEGSRQPLDIKVKLLIVTWKVNNYFGGEYLHPPREITAEEYQPHTLFEIHIVTLILYKPKLFSSPVKNIVLESSLLHALTDTGIDIFNSFYLLRMKNLVGNLVIRRAATL